MYAYGTAVKKHFNFRVYLLVKEENVCLIKQFYCVKLI